MRRSSSRRDGDNLWVTTWLEDGGHLPEHFHPSLEEHWEVLEGSVRLKLDGTWRDLTAADGPLLVARGVRHELRNTQRQPGAPALRGHARRRAGGVPDGGGMGGTRGAVQPRSLPRSLRGAGLDRRASHCASATRPSCARRRPRVQRVVLPIVARGRALRGEQRQVRLALAAQDREVDLDAADAARLGQHRAPAA